MNPADLLDPEKMAAFEKQFEPRAKCKTIRISDRKEIEDFQEDPTSFIEK